MINSVCGIRSTGRICTDIADELEKQGHEVKIAYGREAFVPEQYKKYAVRIGNDWDVRLHALKARVLDASGFGSKKATKKFIEWIKEYDPDVIHLHNIHGYYINIKILFDYLKTYNKKIIWTLHDCWAFTGHSGTCDARNCERWKMGCYSCPMLKEYPKAYFDRSKQNWITKKKLITAIDRIQIVTPSNWLKNFVKVSYLSKFNVQTIPNGIDLNKFYPEKSNFKKEYGINNRIMVLGVSNMWNKDKGLDDFVKLSTLLDEKKYKIVLIGLTEKQIKNISKNIVGIKKTRNIDQLRQAYSAADLFVNLTYCDTYPTVNLEAQACGTPVITYNTGGSIESALRFGKNAIKKGDIYAVKQAIESFHESKELNTDCSQMDKKSSYLKYLSLYCDE